MATTTNNTYFRDGFAKQKEIAAFDKARKDATGARNDAEYAQYMLFIYGNTIEGIKLRSKAATAFKEALVEAGRTERNAQTVVSVCFNAKISKLAKANAGSLEAMTKAFAEADLDTVSKLKRHIADAVSAVERLVEAYNKLSPEDQDAFAEIFEEARMKADAAASA